MENYTEDGWVEPHPTALYPLTQETISMLTDKVESDFLDVYWSRNSTKKNESFLGFGFKDCPTDEDFQQKHRRFIEDEWRGH